MRNGKSAFLTKILVPRRRPDVVRRERLLSVLRSDGGGEIAIIRAPAGFGKTTLLVDLVHEAGENVCWVSLDDWDADPLVFLEYLQQSVRRRAGGRKEGGAGPDARNVLGGLVTSLAEAKGVTWIVLDDFQHLDGAPDVLRLVDELAVRLPDNCRLFVTSRTPPALPSLPRLRLQRRVIEIGPEELAFNRDEVRQYRLNTVGEEMSLEDAERFLQRTQGWPAAVVLLTETGRIAEKPGQVEDYMAAEILARLPATVQEFLLTTSVLETLRGDACDAVTGGGDAAEALAQLERLNVPMLRLQADAPEYRTHSLFRDFLRAKLRAGSPAKYRELNARAGEWLAAQGRAADAVLLLAEAEEWEALAGLIAREAAAAYRLGRWHLIMSWLHVMPAAELATRPLLKVWEIRIRVRMGQADEALRELRSPALEAEGLEPALVAELEALRATALRMKGESGAAVESAKKAVHLSIGANVPVESLMEARKQLGLALCASGLFPEALPELRAVLEFHSQRGDEEESAFVNGVLGSALGAQGNLVESIRHLELARQAWKRIGNNAELAWSLNNLAVTYHRAGQVELARERAEDGIQVSREAGYERQEAYAITSLADLERTAGDVSKALGLYEEARAMGEQLADHALLTHVLTGLAHARRSLGQLDLSEVLAREALVAASERGSHYEKGLALLALGRLQRARDQFDDAIATLDEAAALFDRAEAHKELAEALYYLADAALPMRQGRSLVKLTLHRLATLVSRLGYDDFLAQSCKRAPAAVQYGAANNLGGGYYRQLLRRLTPVPDATGGPRSVEVRALGGFRALLDGREIMSLEWETEKAAEMFLHLLWQGRPMSREEITADLWPDVAPQKARSVFHSTLHRIRRALYKESVVESAGRYSLNTKGSFWLDAREFMNLANKAATAERGHRVPLLQEAAMLYKGPFAQGMKGEWLDEPRLRLEERYLGLAGELAASLSDEGRAQEAVQVCEEALLCDPLSEEMYRQLMLAHASEGDLEAVARVFRRYAEILERELGEKPSREMIKLQIDLREQRTRRSGRVL